MTRHKLSPERRAARDKARLEIIQAVNNFKMRHWARVPYYIPRLFEMKDLHKAVHIARQNMLVRGKVLIEAGFQPHVVKTARKPTILKRLIGHG